MQEQRTPCSCCVPVVVRAATELDLSVEFFDEAGATEHGDGFVFVPSEASELIEFDAAILTAGSDKYRPG